MSKIKIKQISSDGQPEGAVLMTDGEGNNQWVVPEAASGANSYLGPAEDGSYTESRYDGGKAPAVALQPTTLVSSAIDSINEVLGLLLPTAPAPLSSGTLALSTTNSTQRAASGYTTNSVVNAPAAGSSVVRIVAATADTAILQDLGDGTAGVVSYWKDGSAVSGETLTMTEATGDAKTTGVLRITDNKWGGTAVGGGAAPDGFFQSFDSQIVGGAAAVGYNTFQLRHTLSGNTNVLGFVRDSLTANPAISALTSAEVTKTVVKKSGIDHYTTGAVVSLAGTASNLAGETYVSGTILSISGPGTTVNFAAGQAGLPSILAKDTLSFNMAAQNFNIGGNNKTRSAKLVLTATNPNGSGNGTDSTNLITWVGSGAGIDDAAIGTVKRVSLGNTATTDTPAATVFSGATASTVNWDNTQDLSAADFLHEAAIVGGVIRSDRTNYTTGYLPVGIDYSGKSASQYVTYRLNAAGKSSIAITVTGTYSDVWIALPGVSTAQPASINGAWWNGSALYSGAGVPGRSGDTDAGCAAGTLPAKTGTQTFTLTFGTASSSSATDNAIFVRFKLTGSQEITALSIA